MRHLGSVVLALLLGPLVYALAGIGVVKMSDGRVSLSADYLADTSIALAALVCAGLLYAVLVMARLSPLGPVLIGLGYLGVTGWILADRSSFVRLIPADALGVRNAAWAPAGALTALLGVPLLVTALGSRRWRPDRPATRRAAGYPPPVHPVGTRRPAYQPPEYSDPESAPGQYRGPEREAEERWIQDYQAQERQVEEYQLAEYRADEYRSTGYEDPTYRGSGGRGPAYRAAEEIDSDQPTAALPTSGAPIGGDPRVTPGAGDRSVWPVREDPLGEEDTRKLP
ncbi:MAG: hypothetical protein QOI74_208 [Micromonosporaceae bacterium]|jgi:hypothetical protein|nr:hypothetical protein [Micromonosporaceae bacterium]